MNRGKDTKTKKENVRSLLSFRQERFGNCLADVFPAKPALKINNRVFIFIPALEVILINPSAFFLKFT